MTVKRGLAVPLMKRQRKHVETLLKEGVGVIIDPLWEEYPEYRDICNSYKGVDRPLNIGVITDWLEYGSISFQGVPCTLCVARYKESDRSQGLTYIRISPSDRHLRAYQCEYPLRVYPPGNKEELLERKMIPFLIHSDFLLWRPFNEWLLYSRRTRKFLVFLGERVQYLKGYLRTFEAIRELHSKSPKEALECFKVLSPEERRDYFDAGPPWEGDVKFNPEVKGWM